MVSAEDAISAFLAEYDDNDSFHSTLESVLRAARDVMGTEEAPGGSRLPGLMLYLIDLELVGKYIRKRAVLPLHRLPGHRKTQCLERANHYLRRLGRRLCRSTDALRASVCVSPRVRIAN